MYSKSPIIPQHNKAIEIYFVLADISERDAIPVNVRHEGRECITIDTGNKYRLVGGITNADWVMVSSGTGAGSKQTDIFTITGTDMTNGYLDLSQLPKTNTETVFYDGLEEDNGVFYTLATNRITFIDIADIYVDAKITIKYSY